MIPDSRLTYRIAFSSLRGMTISLARTMLPRVVDEATFFTASSRQLAAMMGTGSRLFDDDYRRSVLEAARREVDFILDHNVTPLYWADEAYPTRLLNCDDAPAMLYVSGDTDLNSPHILSIVGTRHATSYGTGFISTLVADLASRLDGLVIVSGLAYGIDVAAHSASLAASVPTVGVLAHGLSTIYPAAHRSIAADMVRRGGMVLTDYRHDAPVHRGNFLARNRIIAALSDATLVVESAEKGGAIVTARIAQSYCRDVFALPGRVVDPYSRGCNRLISTHVAQAVQDATDVISSLRWTERPAIGSQQKLFSPSAPSLSPDESSVVTYLTSSPDASINPMAVALNIPVHRLMAMLVDLEFQGIVRALPGGRYRLASPTTIH